MPFNQLSLSLLTLGVRGDQPVDPGPPRLPDGLHLRWAPGPGVGFPWYGFYLFRRESHPSRPRCLSLELKPFRPGASQSLDLATRLGRLSSAKPLVFTDDFPAQGRVEVDLGQGAGLRFDLPAGVEAGRVDVSIGLRDAGPQTVRTCADFRGLPLSASPSPRTLQGAVFTTAAPFVSPFIALVAIEQWPGGPTGLQTTRQLEIALPCPATRVDLLLTNRSDLRIEALSADGASVGVQTFAPLALAAGTATFTGPAITRLILTSSAVDPALLHQICFECPAGPPGGPGKGPAIAVRALAGTAVVANAVVQGDAGAVVAATLQGAGITAVEIAAGKAALVDLCVWPTKQGVTFGWDEVTGFQYPLCLPVAEPSYPCPGAPVTFDDAQALAFSRVTYPSPQGWNEGFFALHGQLALLVAGGPAAGSMASRVNPPLLGDPLGPAPGLERVKLPEQRPLDLLFLASLQPAMAQMLGLYFADTSAQPGVAYDYLLLADPKGVLGGSAATALSWLAFEADPNAVDGCLATGKSLPSQPAPPVPPPGAARAYALPGARMRSQAGDLVDAQTNVGLWWEVPPPRPAEGGIEEPNRPALYFLQRAFLGLNPPVHPPMNPPVDPPIHPPADAAYQPLLRPYGPPRPDAPQRPVAVVVTTPVNPQSTSGSPEWPPSPLSFHLVDSGLAEGWYSYRIVSQSLFGQQSLPGPAAEWYQWDPPLQQPPLPLPWYYQKNAPGHHSIHPFAVALLDKIPPPRPTGLVATALDPQDRWVLQDEPYQTWREKNLKAVGLRVSWRWTLAHRNQAPDTREFRLYYQPGRLNALLGKVTSVTAASAGESDVATDLARPFPAGVLAGGRLQVEKDSFEILDNGAESPLRLRVRNLSSPEIRPVAGKACILFPDLSRSTAWAKRLYVVGYNEHVTPAFEISRDPQGHDLTAPAGATAAGHTVHLAGAVDSMGLLDPTGVPDLSGLQPWLDHLRLDGDTARPDQLYRILGVDPTGATLMVDGEPALGAAESPWTVGRPARDYEVFLAPPDFDPGSEFEPTLLNSTVFAQIGISAADDKTYTEDDPHWGVPAAMDRFGNEGAVGGPAAIFRVLQTPPEPPGLPDYPDKLLATPADYHSDSFFTFRWKVPPVGLKIHVLRALDDSLFQRDLLIRETREALDPENAEHLDFFPQSWLSEPDPAVRRQMAATAIQGIQSENDYASLKEDAWMVLALLPGNEGIGGGTGPDTPARQRQRLELVKRDGAVRSTRKTFLGTAPASFSSRTLAAYADLLDPALRILAGLPGNEDAFAQITLEPLDPTDPATFDRRGPDDLEPPGHPALPGVGIYLDTLPGLGTNRYFYRAVCVDGAHNRSGLSLSTPPVYLPRVAPPRAPVITKVTGGEREITIEWAPNPEPEVVEYRLYRASTTAEASDIQRMELVHSQSAVVAPGERPNWTDTPLPGRTTYFYRVLARSSSGLLSAPSTAVAAQASDQTPPEPPPWVAAAWKEDGSGIDLRWSATGEGLETMVLRQSGNAWFSVSRWLAPGVEQFLDSDASADVVNQYRLRVRNPAGNLNVKYLERTVESR